MTQHERILDYMKRHGSITSFEAFANLGVMHLSGRISELQRMGTAIEKRTEKKKNRYGEPTSYTRYSLQNQGEEHEVHG